MTIRRATVLALLLALLLGNAAGACWCCVRAVVRGDDKAESMRCARTRLQIIDSESSYAS